MVNLLGDPNVTLEERRNVRALLERAGDYRATQALVAGTSDMREHDPEGRLPSLPDKVSISVSEVCDLLLRRIWGMKLRSAYVVSDWKEWWSARKDRSPDEIREEVRKYNEEHKGQ